MRRSWVNAAIFLFGMILTLFAVLRYFSLDIMLNSSPSLLGDPRITLICLYLLSGVYISVNRNKMESNLNERFEENLVSKTWLRSVVTTYASTFDYRSRSDRTAFFNYCIVYSVLYAVFSTMDYFQNYNFSFDPFAGFSVWWAFANIPTSVALSVRRLRDINRSPYWIFLYVTVVGIFYIIYLNLKPTKSDSPKVERHWEPVAIIIVFLSVTVFGYGFAKAPHEIRDVRETELSPKFQETITEGLISGLISSECTYYLLDGSCLRDGLFEIVNESEVVAPPDMTVPDIWCLIGNCAEVTVVRVARRINVFAGEDCYLDHVEIFGPITPPLNLLVEKMIHDIAHDGDRCDANGMKAQFASLLPPAARRPIGVDVFLSSPGGFVSSGIQLSETMKKYGVTTIISADAQCASACTLLFLAGKERKISVGGTLEFHRAYNIDTYECTAFSGVEEQYIRLVGRKLGNMILDNTLVCNPAELYSFNRDAALTMGLATR